MFHHTPTRMCPPNMTSQANLQQDIFSTPAKNSSSWTYNMQGVEFDHQSLQDQLGSRYFWTGEYLQHRSPFVKGLVSPLSGGIKRKHTDSPVWNDKTRQGLLFSGGGSEEGGEQGFFSDQQHPALNDLFATPHKPSIFTPSKTPSSGGQPTGDFTPSIFLTSPKFFASPAFVKSPWVCICICIIVLF